MTATELNLGGAGDGRSRMLIASPDGAALADACYPGPRTTPLPRESEPDKRKKETNEANSLFVFNTWSGKQTQLTVWPLVLASKRGGRSRQGWNYMPTGKSASVQPPTAERKPKEGTASTVAQTAAPRFSRNTPGWRAATRNRASAGPSGLRRPCSQLRNV